MEKMLERNKKLIRINDKRNELALDLQNGLITEQDIINLLRKGINYGVRTVNVSGDPKKAMLKNIFNCPFLLCDQDILSIEFKQLLPHFLSSRYETEKETLRIYLEQAFIDENEYHEELDNLKFFYYESSNDGKCILETGHAFFENEKIKAR